jgi:hypothetical protein
MGKLGLIKLDLESWLEQKIQVLNNEESKEYPNEERIEKISNQIEILENAVEQITELISTLEDYE